MTSNAPSNVPSSVVRAACAADRRRAAAAQAAYNAWLASNGKTPAPLPQAERHTWARIAAAATSTYTNYARRRNRR